MNDEYIIFGAGKRGRELFEHLGEKKVAYFCDNNDSLIGTKICGVQVISFSRLLELKEKYRVIISVEEKSLIRRQLKNSGIDDYIIYISDEKKDGNDIRAVVPEHMTKIHACDSYVKESERIDPINDFEAFSQLVKKCKSDPVFEGWIDKPGKKSETLTYGHFRALKEYANISDANVDTFPRITHGVFFFEPYFDASVATVFASPFYKKQMNERYPYIPCFCIGPYINYTSITGSNECNTDDNVLVVLDHSIESEDIEYDFNRLNETLFCKLREKYRKVFLCVYWYDADKDLYKKINEAGVTVVSAGFRFDDMFIFRLRKIFDQCSNVVVCGRTSALIYALSLGKKLTYFKTLEEQRDFNQLYDRCYYDLSELEERNKTWESVLLKNEGKSFADFSSEDRDILRNYFGVGIKQTPEYIKKIYEISNDIWTNCEFRENQYPIGIYKTYLEYQKKYDFAKLSILSEALGNGFWNI